jgi:hypothetical protein
VAFNATGLFMARWRPISEQKPLLRGHIKLNLLLFQGSGSLRKKGLAKGCG